MPRPLLRALLRTFLLAAAMAATACGGGSGGVIPPPATSTPVPAPVPVPAPPQQNPLPALPVSGNVLVLASDADDPVGKGGTFTYTQANAQLRVTQTGELTLVEVEGDEVWIGQIAPVSGATELRVGDYADLAEMGDSGVGHQLWAPERLARGCSQPKGRLRVSRAAYADGQLIALSLEFEQRCTGVAGALRGQLRWEAGDPTQPPGPVAAPAGLWQAPAGSLPVSGNVVYLEGASGEPLTQGRTLVYTPENALIGFGGGGRALRLNVQGDQHWFGVFHTMSTLNRLQVGHYPGLLSSQRFNPAKGGLGWFQPLLTCEFMTRSWVQIDSVRYEGDWVKELEMRFELRCADGSAAPLRGHIRWSAADTRRPPAPVLPVPAGLWRPDAVALPVAGSYLHLVSEPGDWVGGGATQTLIPASQEFVVFETDGRVKLRIGGVGGWTGTFKGPAGSRRVEAGYYGQLLNPFTGNPARGGLDFSSPGRGCSGQGWFAVDAVSYSHGVLRMLDLRFETRCEGATAALRGQLHWDSVNPVALGDSIDGPLTPLPDPESVRPPASGSYVLLDSGPDDFIGQGGVYLYTLANAEIQASMSFGRLFVSVRGEEQWLGAFSPPPGQTLAASASYTKSQRTPAEPDVAGLDWSGQGRGCNGNTSSWSIDRLQVAGELVRAVDLVFEQFCDGAQTALRGRVHLEDGDATAPPGPVFPAPDTLWRLPAAMVPPVGNYFYLHSPPGAFVGEGRDRLFTQTTDTLRVAAEANGFTLIVNDAEGQRWDLQIVNIQGLGTLRPGHYDGLRRAISHNPARGGLDFGGASRGCNELSAWYVIDDIVYEAAAVIAVELRFEMLCEGVSPPVHGQLRWSR